MDCGVGVWAWVSGDRRKPGIRNREVSKEPVAKVLLTLVCFFN